MKVSTLCKLFNSTLGETYNTRLLGGFDEPFYKAPNSTSEAQIQFRNDYSASAMHEISHWCIAGVDRLKLDDFGYWYAPDGRTEEQQRQFEQVEIKPQALEWLFCVAAGMPFRLSLDNLNGSVGDTRQFAEAVVKQAKHYASTGKVPSRGGEWLAQLSKVSGNRWQDSQYFQYEALL